MTVLRCEMHDRTDRYIGLAFGGVILGVIIFFVTMVMETGRKYDSAREFCKPNRLVKIQYAAEGMQRVICMDLQGNEITKYRVVE